MPIPKTISYLRKSTDKQDLSFDLQKAEIEKKFKIKKYYMDEISGGANISKKSGLLRCLEDLKKNDTLIVYRYDRLTRSVMEFCWIEKEVKKRGANIISASEEAFAGDTPEQNLMRMLSACFAEYEKAIISKRTKDGLAAKKRRGEKTGGHVPYAYQIKTNGGRVKVLEPKADEMEVLNEMKKWKKEGLTYHRIVDKLNNLEIPSATGGIWHYTSVYNVMNRREYQYTNEG